MTKSENTRAANENPEMRWRRACQLLDRHLERDAFKEMHRAALDGYRAAMNSMGYFYDIGIGTRRNTTLAMRWYRQAARHGDSLAAANLGTVYRDRGQVRLARKWFQRSVDMGHEEARLEIAKLEARSAQGRKTAITSLRELLESSDIANMTPAVLEEAMELLANLRAQR